MLYYRPILALASAVGLLARPKHPVSRPTPPRHVSLSTPARPAVPIGSASRPDQICQNAASHLETLAAHSSPLASPRLASPLASPHLTSPAALHRQTPWPPRTTGGTPTRGSSSRRWWPPRRPRRGWPPRRPSPQPRRSVARLLP